ncbi:MAG: biopolymer transporter ExbD [Gemmatimonadota bacterium]
MAIKQGGFKRKSGVSDEIPSSSLADIAFLLLIFFMVTTVFRTSGEQPIDWVAAEATQKIDEKKKNVLELWVLENGNVFVNDRPVAMADVSSLVAPMYVETDRRLVTSIRADKDVPYIFIDQVQKELQEAGAVRVVFATELERRMSGERR